MLAHLIIISWWPSAKLKQLLLPVNMTSRVDPGHSPLGFSRRPSSTTDRCQYRHRDSASSLRASCDAGPGPLGQ
nr:hypothetical protein CFP56_69492 [Quercus suber]